MHPETSSHHALSAARKADWRPGLGGDAVHGEIFASSRENAGAALALAFAADWLRGRAVAPPEGWRWLWVQDVRAMRLGGRPYRPGLPGVLRDRLIHVVAGSPEDALFALEEGLRCRDFAFVLGEVAGNPKALSFTASRRLSLAVERHGVPLWLVRPDAARDLAAARMRWEARSSPSPPPPLNPDAPGRPSWRAELFRARSHPPGEWILRDEGDALLARRPAAQNFADPADHGDLADSLRDRSLAAS